MNSLPRYAANWQIRLVDTPQDVEDFLAWVDDISGMISVDTETCGLDWTQRSFTKLVQFGDDNCGWAVPTSWHGRTLMGALQKIRDKEIPVAFWNSSYDIHALESDGFPVPHWHCIHDGYVLHHLLTPHIRHGLKWSAGEELGRWATSGETMLKHQMSLNNWTWDTVPVDLPIYWQYGVIDTLITQKMMRVLGPQVEKAGMKPAYEREMQALAVMHAAETRGMRVDHRHAAETRRVWLNRAVILKDKMAAQGLDNPNSTQQVAGIFKELGWAPEDFTESGQEVVDKVVLARLAEKWPGLANSIVEYKRLTKWVGSYLTPFAESGGRVHPGINTLRAKTGRMSITSPALQTLPSGGSAGAIRRCVLPEPGEELWAIDYDGQEARIFANLSGDPGMAAAYKAGDDLYTHVARIVWDDESIVKADPRRTTAKVILLAFTYGAGLDRLAEASGLPVRDVERFVKVLFNRFPSVKTLTGDHALGGTDPGDPAREAVRNLADTGLSYVMTTGGRRFSMPEGESYKAVNGIMQGSGADVLKKAIVRLDRAGLGQHIVVPVHDEVVFSFPKGEGASMAAEAAALMTDNDWDIPLTVDVTGPLKNWGEAYA